VLAGETFLLLIMGGNLGGRRFFGPRILFLLRVSPVFIIALIPRLFFPQGIIAMATSCLIYILIVLYIYRKLIFDASFLKRSKE